MSGSSRFDSIFAAGAKVVYIIKQRHRHRSRIEVHNRIAANGTIACAAADEIERLVVLAMGAIAYSTVHFIEAYGLWLQRRWAEWLGVAASIGQTAFSALRNPFSLLSRLDDLAQDIESIQLSDKAWKVIDQAIVAFGASYALSERLARVACEYCGTANPVGSANCIACGAPMGEAHPTTCRNCGFVVSAEETICPNCNQKLQ